MFERRLYMLLGAFVLATVVIAGRLFQLQVLQGEQFERLSERALESPLELLQPIRGRILDRNGQVLAADTPAYDVTIHYGVLSMDDRYLDRLEARESRRLGDDTEARRRRVQDRIAAMWTQLSRAAELSTGELRRRRDEICRRVEALRRYLVDVRERKGYIDPPGGLRLAEDELFHPILRNVPADVRARIERDLGEVTYLRVESSVVRSPPASAAVTHLLGRLQQVSAQGLETDPARDDEGRRYLPGELAGASGVERLAEQALRGERGYRQKDLDGRTLEQLDPRDGSDVRLSIDLDLQERIVDLIGAAVTEHPQSTGGSCVVIRTRTREVLALASYPVYSDDEFRHSYRKLRDDTKFLPLLYRPVGGAYPPGSIMKPLVLWAGLGAGAASPHETIECRGQLFDDVDAWHCWTHWRQAPPHGPLTADRALQHSCNIFFYTLGQRLGAERLCAFYRLALRGPADDGRLALGLVEELPGMVPDAVVKATGRGIGVGEARNLAIGQGALLLTPLQAANMFATLATGEARAPTLLVDDPRPRPGYRLAADPDIARVIQNGLYLCANEPGGSAYVGGHLDDIVVCGKTGSAQASRRVIEEQFDFVNADGRPVSAVAPTVEAAREQLGLGDQTAPTGRRIASVWPPKSDEDDKLSHAWFAAYAPREDPQVAIAVLIEFGGSGGRTATPVGLRVIEALADAGYLRRDGAAVAHAR